MTVDTLEVRSADPYQMPRTAFDALQADLVSRVRSHLDGAQDLCAVWTPQDHPYADLVRRLEHTVFPSDIPRVLTPFTERSSKFLMIVDLRDGRDRVVHGARVCSPRFAGTGGTIAPGSTGFPCVDECVREGKITSGRFREFCEERGYDIPSCVSVETCFATLGWEPHTPGHPSRTPARDGFSVAHIGYTRLYLSLVRNGALRHRSCLFGLANRTSRISFARLGIEYENLPGQSPPTDRHSFGLVAAPYGDKLVETLSVVDARMPVPELRLDR